MFPVQDANDSVPSVGASREEVIIAVFDPLSNEVIWEVIVALSFG